MLEIILLNTNHVLSTATGWCPGSPCVDVSYDDLWVLVDDHAWEGECSSSTAKSRQLVPKQQLGEQQVPHHCSGCPGCAAWLRRSGWWHSSWLGCKALSPDSWARWNPRGGGHTGKGTAVWPSSPETGQLWPGCRSWGWTSDTVGRQSWSSPPWARCLTITHMQKKECASLDIIPLYSCSALTHIFGHLDFHLLKHMLRYGVTNIVNNLNLCDETVTTKIDHWKIKPTDDMEYLSWT